MNPPISPSIAAFFSEVLLSYHSWNLVSVLGVHGQVHGDGVYLTEMMTFRNDVVSDDVKHDNVTSPDLPVKIEFLPVWEFPENAIFKREFPGNSHRGIPPH